MINKQFLIILIILSGPISIKAQSNVNTGQNTDAYLVDDSQFAVLASKDKQDLITLVEEHKKKITEKENEYNSKITQLEKKVSVLEAKLKKTNETKSGTTDALSAASPEHNKLHTFSEYATIHYNIPSGSTGEIIVYNQQGIAIKTAPGNKNGKSVIYVKDIPPGIYTYSLVLNGKSILTKQMLVAR